LSYGTTSKKRDKATCNFYSMNLVYQDGTISNLKKHLKIYKNKVPELKKPNIKQENVLVIDMLNNKTS
ncbi:25431_t:CDS:1, partial [Gigaspora margarita]